MQMVRRAPRLYSPCDCGRWIDHVLPQAFRCSDCKAGMDLKGKRDLRAKRGAVRPFYRAHLKTGRYPQMRECKSCETAIPILRESCDSCRLNSTSRSTVLYQWRKSIRGRVYACLGCGVEFSPLAWNRGREACSDECAREAKRAAKALAGALRRSRLKDGERVVFNMVFERDKRQCASCSLRMRKEDRGSILMCAPELDHATPIALGGVHTYQNIQLMCRRCNGEKGAMTMDDYMLITQVAA